MAIDYKTPDQIAEQYLLHLKSLKPEVNTDQTDSDWWIRSRVIGGTFSGIYADQQKISNDAFPQLARREALERFLNEYFDEGFEPATQASGTVKVTGASGSTVGAGTQFIYEPNGNVYTATETTNFGTAASASFPVVSVSSGQSQNLLEGAELSLPSPPAGVDSTAVVFDGNLADARNEESNEQAAARILARIRTPLAGGKVSDYVQFALDANSSVVSANVLRFPFGFGTVGVVITAGTTDIDEAVDNDQPVIQIPSDELIAEVQAYIDTHNPVTDCATVMAAASVAIDVTVNVQYASGDNDSIFTGQTLTQEELVQREVRRAIYKMPPGGRKIGASGSILASEIEEAIDNALSASPYTEGSKAQILVDRQVQDLSATGANRLLLGNQLAVPGTITVVEI